MAICQPGGQIRANQSFAITLQKPTDVLSSGGAKGKKTTTLVAPVKLPRSKGSQSRQPKRQEDKKPNAPGSVKRIYQTPSNTVKSSATSSTTATTTTVVSVSQTGAELAYFQTTPAQSAAQRNEYVRLQQENQLGEAEQAAGDSEAQNALIKRLLGAEKLDVQKKGQNVTPVTSSTQCVSISELKTLGISLKQSENTGSPVSVKSEGSSSSTTPTQLVPPTPPPATGVDVKQEHIAEVKEKKPEFKPEIKDVKIGAGSAQKGARKRESVDTNDGNASQTDESNNGGNLLTPLPLAEAPIRRNVDLLPPLEAELYARTGMDSE